MPPVEWTCMVCHSKLSSPSDDTTVICKTMDIHYAACEKYKSTQIQSRSNPRAVNERALDKMEVKDKVNSMAPAEWSRFENRWELWKSDQPPEQNNSIYLLDLFPNARKEISCRLTLPYVEEKVLAAAKEVMIVKTNTGISLLMFSHMTQKFNMLLETFIGKLKDMAVPCNFSLK